jgi:hypothetical protein
LWSDVFQAERGWGDFDKRELRADIPRKEKRNNNQNGFFFLLGEGAISQTEPTKDDGARCCGEGASSLPQRARDGKTQQ